VELIEFGSNYFYIPEEGKDNLTSLLINAASDNSLQKATGNGYENVSKSKSTINSIKQFVKSRKMGKK